MENTSGGTCNAVMEVKNGEKFIAHTVDVFGGRLLGDVCKDLPMVQQTVRSVIYSLVSD